MPFDEQVARVLVGEQVQLAVAIARARVGQAVVLVGRRAQRLGQQRELYDTQRELPALGDVDAPCHPHDVSDVQAQDAVVGVLPERVHPHDRLDLAGKISNVEKRGLAVASPGDDTPGDLVGQVGVCARVQLAGVVRGEHVGDARAAVPQADRRVGVDPFRAQPLQLGAAFVEFDALVGRCVDGLHGQSRLCLLILGGHAEDDTGAQAKAPALRRWPANRYARPVRSRPSRSGRCVRSAGTRRRPVPASRPSA